MTDLNIEDLIGKLSDFFQPHPWHGVAMREKGQDEYVNAFIEIVPSDKIKYELDKASGFLKIDRPRSLQTSCQLCTVSYRKHTAQKSVPIIQAKYLTVN